MFPDSELSRYPSLGQRENSLHDVGKTCISQYLCAKPGLDGIPVEVHKHFTAASSKSGIWLQTFVPVAI